MRRRFLTMLLGLPGLGLTAAQAKNATFANPTVFVGLVQWSDKVLTE
jgi:hypothetical protein